MSPSTHRTAGIVFVVIGLIFGLLVVTDVHDRDFSTIVFVFAMLIIGAVLIVRSKRAVR